MQACPTTKKKEDKNMGINISKASKQFRDAIANYKLGAFTLADEALKLRKDISAFQTCIESDMDLIEKTQSEAKKADLQAEIERFALKIEERTKAYNVVAAEEEKRTAPFIKMTQELYDKYVEFRGQANADKYKKAVAEWLKNHGVVADAKSVWLIATAVGVRAKSNRALYKDSTSMTTTETKKKFCDLLARVLVDMAGAQLPVYKWSYKPASK